MRYRITGINSDGRKKKCVIEAIDQKTAITQAHSNGIFPYKVNLTTDPRVDISSSNTYLPILLGIFTIILFTSIGLNYLGSSGSSSPYQYDNSPANTQSNDYISTKPTWQMDGWEIKQFNDAWDSMSEEQKRIQIYREFGDIVDIQE